MEIKYVNLIEKLKVIARDVISSDDPSHDFEHACRVLKNALYLQSLEGGDLEVIIPAALFHDAIVYPKDDPRSKLSSKESSETAIRVLLGLDYFPKEKIQQVVRVIYEHSFSKGIVSDLVESKIIQDADRLEVTGAIAIMRVFCSSGQMKRGFYSSDDPFCVSRKPEGKKYALDFFYDRLLRIGDKMNTLSAKEMAKSRVSYLHGFIEQFRIELEIS
jgi:uncharacterized protein